MAGEAVAAITRAAVETSMRRKLNREFVVIIIPRGSDGWVSVECMLSNRTASCMKEAGRVGEDSLKCD
jgi:hypothetical protein